MPNPNVKQVSNSALNFMNTLQGEQQTAFAGNQAALQSLQSAWAPILAGGAIPAGYSPGLDSMLQSQIRSNGAQGTSNAENASELQQRQAGCGNNALPTGSQEAVNAQIEATGQQDTAKNLQAEKTADYQQGVTNLTSASQAELGIAQGEDETGLASGSNSAGGLASSAGQAEWQENQTSSPAAILGDIGSAAGDATSIFG
jgi:hypothetical protein